MTSVAIVEYGVGNVHSVVNAVLRCGLDPDIVQSGEELRRADPDMIVLPGVGAIGPSLRLIRERELETALRECVIEKRRAFLGICVGMQMLADVCEEHGEHRAFGWIPGRVRHLREHADEVVVPHVGWNDVAPTGLDPVFKAVADQSFYFTHSYFFDCPEEYVAAQSDYGGPFTVAVCRGNIRAVQFHPEKSSLAGETLLTEVIQEHKESSC